MRLRRGVALVLAGLVATTGCSGVLRRGLATLGLASRYATGVSEEDLREALDRYARRLTVGIGTAAERIESESDDREMRRRALLWRVRLVPAVQQAAAAEPRQAFVGLLTLAIGQRKYLTEGDGAGLFGPLQAVAVEEAQALEDEALTVGQVFLSPEELEGIRWQVEDITWKYPIRGVFQVEGTLQGFAQAEGWGSFAWVVAIPLAPFRALEGVDTGAQAILEFNGTAREFARLTAQLPQLLRWEGQLLLYDIESRETVRATLSLLETVARSAQRLSEAAERLPDDVGRETSRVLADLEARQATLRDTMAEARSLLAGLDQSMERGIPFAETLRQLAEQVERAGATLEAFVREARGPAPSPGTPPGRPFDIRDYERTLARTEAAVSELRGLAGDLRGAFLAVLNAVLWRLVLVLLAFFGLRLVFRLLDRRLGFGSGRPS